MTITHDHQGMTPEKDELLVLKMELLTALAIVDELIKQKQWESSKKS